ncbi:MAG TPA: hypothetical protein VFL57_03195 [Bryobacteraceae bacterium]|nr:hypothetical protein [Bryobacteraceae bacterium]
MRSLILAFLLSAATLAAADITGKWRGSFESTNDNGETRKGTAYLDLKQDGSTVTGVAGPNENEPHQLRNGKFENDKLTFTILTGDTEMRVELTLAGNELTGQATREGASGSRTAKIAVKREQ